TNLGLVNQVRIVGQSAGIQLLEQAAIDIKPADMRGGERDVALWFACKLGLVQAVYRSAGDVLDRDTGLSGELLANVFVDEIAKAPSPCADDQRILCADRTGRKGAGQHPYQQKFAYHFMLLEMSQLWAWRRA